MLLSRLSVAASRTSALSSVRRGSTATVAEQMVNCTFVLVKQKKRVTVAGMVGWSLLETAQHHNLPVHGAAAENGWNYTTFGEGPGSVEDHVVVAKDFADVVGPPTFEEEDLLTMLDPENYQPTSRLAACIKLTKDMEGITVLVPDTNPDLTRYH
uniref:Uncharacterized protein n=1 Tax=Coccolithus braarudii TaxID=221442 RepID=A0A7S0L5W8_9EUKA|mmetsp:Transcript_21562/g.46416  ORF Transcript_21562/g.46416 Transcript_21562/m.46416 type:complete len:155 (+) Transcript_21562:90-554(+)